MFGQHAAFIIPSYAATIAVLGGLVIWLHLQHKARKRELAELEKAGVTRRSQVNPNK